MPATGAWELFRTAKTKISCTGGSLVNADNWRDSVLWMKTQSPASCPPGAANPGLTMPPQMGYTPMMPSLNADEIGCLEGFLKAITGE
jgi:hypothetical protein